MMHKIIRILVISYYLCKHCFELFCENFHYIPKIIRIVALALTLRYVMAGLLIAFRIKHRSFLGGRIIFKFLNYTRSVVKYILKRGIIEDLEDLVLLLDNFSMKVQNYILYFIIYFLNMEAQKLGKLHLVCSFLAGFGGLGLTLTLICSNDSIDLHNILILIQIFIIVFYFFFPAFLGGVASYILPTSLNSSNLAFPKINFTSLCFTSFSLLYLALFLLNIVYSGEFNFYYVVISLLLNSISLLLSCFNLITTILWGYLDKLNLNSWLLCSILFFILMTLPIFLLCLFCLAKDYDLGEEEFKLFREYLLFISKLFIFFTLGIVLFNLKIIFYKWRNNLSIIIVILVIFIYSICFSSLIFGLIGLFTLIYICFSADIHHIVLFLICYSVSFFLAFSCSTSFEFGIYDLYLQNIILIFLFLIFFIFTNKMLVGILNIKNRKLLTSQVAIVLFSGNLIFLPLYINIPIEINLINFIWLYFSHLFIFSSINLILLVIPDLLQNKFILFFPSIMKRQQLYEIIEEDQQLYMHKWFLGMEILEDKLPFYEEMPDQQEDEVEMDEVDFYFYPLDLADAEEETYKDAIIDYIFVCIEHYEDVIKVREERLFPEYCGTLNWKIWMEGELNELHDYEEDKS